MNPLMLLNPKLWAAVVVAVALAASHWKAYHMGFASVQAQWDKQRADMAEQSAAVAREAEQKTADIQALADNLRKTKDAQIRNLDTRLAAALDGLRNRPDRPGASDLPTDTGAGSATGCTGAQLFRPDAGFLVREAARADRLLAQLGQCQAQYEAAREALSK